MSAWWPSTETGMRTPSAVGVARPSAILGTESPPAMSFEGSSGAEPAESAVVAVVSGKGRQRVVRGKSDKDAAMRERALELERPRTAENLIDCADELMAVSGGGASYAVAVLEGPLSVGAGSGGFQFGVVGQRDD